MAVRAEPCAQRRRNEGQLGRWSCGSERDLPRGLQHYRAGRTAEAIVRWRQELELDPGNYLIRKQIWAVESPDRFYDGAVDYDWQREQTAKGL